MKLTQQELNEMIQELDADGSGEIEVDEFLAVLSKDLALDYTADEVGSAFKMFASRDNVCVFPFLELSNIVKM